MLDQLQIDSALVFTRTKREVDIVEQQLNQAGIAVAAIHGDFRQRQRNAALAGFRSGRHRVLVATDIAARGWDVEGISHVINYDVPEHPEDYVHRVGRTGRAEAEGDAITFVSPEEQEYLRKIEEFIDRRFDQKQCPGFDYTAADLALPQPVRSQRRKPRAAKSPPVKPSRSRRSAKKKSSKSRQSAAASTSTPSRRKRAKRRAT